MLPEEKQMTRRSGTEQFRVSRSAMRPQRVSSALRVRE